MKKIIIASVLLMFCSIGFSQNINSKLAENAKNVHEIISKQNIWVLDTILGYSGQGTTGWDFDQTEIVKSRNERGLPTLIELREKIYGTATWVNVYQSQISYFDNDSIFEFKVKEWNTNTNNWNSNLSYYEKKDEDGKFIETYLKYWDNDGQYFYAGDRNLYYYNSNSTLNYILDQDWYNGWDDLYKYFYYYDENNNDTLILQQNNVGFWRDLWITRKTYDEQNLMTKYQEWGYDNYWDEWYDYLLTDYTYYDNGKIQSEFTQRYDLDAEEWYNASKTDYYYNENWLLSWKEEYDLETSGNSLKYEYTYNSNLDETSFFLYSLSSKGWTLFYKVFDTYDANFNQTSFYSQTLDGSWYNTIKEEYFWNNFLSVENIYNDNEISIYPNPASDFINILAENFVKAEIIDISGTVIISSTKSQVDISNLENGLYIVFIKTNKNISTKKIIIER